MTRGYTLKRRAERQADTRRRIVEAAVDLHSTVGPGQTTISMVAEKAGVQRHTLYAHFPDERSLYQACSGLTEERDPIPDAAAWRAIADHSERLVTGLQAVYGWYDRNASLVACVLRDAEHHAVTRELSERLYAPQMAAWHEVLGAKANVKQQALLRLALSFFTWRTLVRDGGLTQDAAIAAMVKAFEAANGV